MQTDIQPYFYSFHGIVREISIHSDNNTYLNYILVENEEGEVAYLIVSPNTYFVYNVMVSIGSTVTGYFLANAPTPLIYPPQYTTIVLVTEPLWQVIKVDYFDEDLVSSDGVLKLNIGDHTRIVTQDGQPYDGELENRPLVVYYGVSTRSIPAIAIPLQVVVLDLE